MFSALLVFFSMFFQGVFLEEAQNCKREMHLVSGFSGVVDTKFVVTWNMDL